MDKTQTERTFDGFIDGAEAYFKQAGLTAAETGQAWAAIVGALGSRAKSAFMEGGAPDWSRVLRETMYQMPTPHAVGTLGALASVPLTATFGRRDEYGRKAYVRNALMAGIAGGSLPRALPTMVEMLEKYEGDKREWDAARPPSA